MRVLRATWSIIERLAPIAALSFISFVVLGLTFPRGPRPVRSPVADTENTCFNLRNAITTFHVEYRRYPLEIENSDLTTTTDDPLLSILMGAESEEALNSNPRRIAFYSGRPAKQVDGKYFRGVQPFEDGSGILWDRWGNQ